MKQERTPDEQANEPREKSTPPTQAQRGTQAGEEGDPAAGARPRPESTGAEAAMKQEHKTPSEGGSRG